ncbi:MAG: glycosyltransferase family 4 protein [Acidobacteria bacterium]|nr:glycosyltransferase family 4 protein [Acidobacteriota bacterium]
MRIALDARYVNGRGSGIGSYTSNLIRALVDEDRTVELLLVRGAGHAPTISDGPRVREVRFPFPANSPFTRLWLGAVLRRHAFDVFHAPFAVIPAGVRTPVVATVHDVMWMVNPRFISHSRLARAVGGMFHRASLRATMARADRVLTVSKASRDAITERWPGRRDAVSVAPNGVDTTTFHPIDPAACAEALRGIAEPGTPFVLTVGDASPHKNHLNAVRAFADAFADRPAYRMILVRRFSRRDVEFCRLLRSPGVAGRVIVLPHVPVPTLNALYNAARIYLHPSLYEGFGLPALEAMTVGTPVVTSNSGALAEVAGNAALQVNPADPGAIAAALDRLDRDLPERERLAAAGRARAAQFTWSGCARAVLATYRELAQPETRVSGGRSA